MVFGCPESALSVPEVTLQTAAAKEPGVRGSQEEEEEEEGGEEGEKAKQEEKGALLILMGCVMFLLHLADTPHSVMTGFTEPPATPSPLPGSLNPPCPAEPGPAALAGEAEARLCFHHGKASGRIFL